MTVRPFCSTAEIVNAVQQRTIRRPHLASSRQGDEP